MINVADNLNQINVDVLPPQLRQLTKIVGLYDTYRLVEERGGIPLFIADKPDDAKVLIDIIGVDSTKKLCHALGNKTIELPKLDKIKIQLRDMAIFIDSKSMNNIKLARKYNLTRRQIINILNSLKEEDPTSDMFDTVLKTGS